MTAPAHSLTPGPFSLLERAPVQSGGMWVALVICLGNTIAMLISSSVFEAMKTGECRCADDGRHAGF